MERTAVRSRDLAIIGYDAAKQTLEVAFRSGGVYCYDQVPEKVYQDLMQATSHGTFFNRRIKDKYPSRKIR